MTEIYYAEFLHPGIFFSETSVKKITKEEFDNPISIKVPGSSFGFRVKTRTETEVNGEILKGNFKNESGWFYIGKVLTRSVVAIVKGENTILYRNMVNNNYEKVVMTEFGQAIPLTEKDTVIRECNP